LSLAGIPLTAGFLSKFMMLKAAFNSRKDLWIVIFAVVMAAVSVYYYFRLIQAMYFKQGNGDVSVQLSSSFKYTMIVLAGVTILLGIFPNLLINWLYF